MFFIAYFRIPVRFVLWNLVWIKPLQLFHILSSNWILSSFLEILCFILVPYKIRLYNWLLHLYIISYLILLFINNLNHCLNITVFLCLIRNEINLWIIMMVIDLLVSVLIPSNGWLIRRQWPSYIIWLIMLLPVHFRSITHLRLMHLHLHSSWSVVCHLIRNSSATKIN